MVTICIFREILKNRTYFPLVSPVNSQCLVVLDPFNFTNNITAGLYRFDEIRKCFSDVLMKDSIKSLV